MPGLCREGGSWNYYVKSIEKQFYKMEKVLGMDGDEGSTLQMCLILIRIHKMVQMAIFISIFYHNKKMERKGNKDGSVKINT